jgi:hypothetical protein
MKAEQDRGMTLLTNASMIACALAALVIYMTGWRGDEAAVVFILCLGYLTLFGLARS